MTTDFATPLYYEVADVWLEGEVAVRVIASPGSSGAGVKAEAFLTIPTIRRVRAQPSGERRVEADREMPADCRALDAKEEFMNEPEPTLEEARTRELQQKRQLLEKSGSESLLSPNRPHSPLPV